MGIVQINNIRPFADSIAEAAVGLMVEPFRVMLRQPRVREVWLYTTSIISFMPFW